MMKICIYSVGMCRDSHMEKKTTCNTGRFFVPRTDHQPKGGLTEHCETLFPTAQRTHREPEFPGSVACLSQKKLSMLDLKSPVPVIFHRYSKDIP